MKRHVLRRVFCLLLLLSLLVACGSQQATGSSRSGITPTAKLAPASPTAVPSVTVPTLTPTPTVEKQARGARNAEDAEKISFGPAQAIKQLTERLTGRNGISSLQDVNPFRPTASPVPRKASAAPSIQHEPLIPFDIRARWLQNGQVAPTWFD